jgi:hypothetical protein
MHRSGQRRHAQSARNQSPVNVESRNSSYKRALGAISYAAIGAIVAFLLAYWPASAGDILAKLNIVPTHLTSASDSPDRTHQADRLAGISFEQRWSAVPAIANQTRGNSGEHKQPQAETRIEKIPFSCELAFSRLISKGNFSTRCVARVDDPGMPVAG